MACTAQTITIASPSTRAKELALSARKLLEDLKELEVGVMTPNDWQRCPRRVPSTIRRKSSPHQSPATTPRHQSLFSHQPLLNPASSDILKKSMDKKHVTGTFVTFCEHLLFTNHVWKQERELRSLQASLKAAEKAKCSNAFKSFCDRLLLSNRIWQLERQIQELAAEGERNRRARVAAITHAAKQMAVDVRKEAMVEEFVLELLDELERSKGMVSEMREKHEEEIREIHGDWLKEYRQVVKENEELCLEKHARLAEQEVSNELEQSLYDAVEHRIKLDGDSASTLVEDAFDEASLLFPDSSSYSVDGTDADDLTEVDEGMSTMSSATCVSFQELSNWSRKSSTLARQRWKSRKSTDASTEKERLSRRESGSLRKLETAPYAGFSFNPLFFGNPGTLVVSPSRPENAETPLKVALKLAPPTLVRERRDSTTRASRLVGPTGTRGPWRF